MIMLTRDDALKGLKRCMRLAKQDILLCGYTDDPQTWENHAVTRRSVYKWLTTVIEEHGVDQAYLLAKKRYDDLPLFLSDDNVVKSPSVFCSGRSNDQIRAESI